MIATKAQRTVSLDRYGPTHTNCASAAEAARWCRRLTTGHGENFSVLSRFVRPALVDDFCAVYSFCRCADDLGDETGSTEESLELLAWWREELHACYSGDAKHPVFVALGQAISRHGLEINLFEDLITAFEMDQTKRRYDTWEELLGYCKLSADPVGRLVLRLVGEKCDSHQLAASDAICTALQLTNHWQDVRSDKLQRDRIYVPKSFWLVDRFEERLESTVRKGYAPDREFLPKWREMMHNLVVPTWALYEVGAPLVEMLRPENRPLIWLFLSGGTGTLGQIQLWNYETCVSRPKLSKMAKGMLILRALWSARGAHRSQSSVAS